MILRTTLSQKKRANRIDAERSRIANIGLASSSRDGAMIRAAAISALRRGRSPEQVAEAVRVAMLPLAETVARGMTASYLASIARARSTASRVLGGQPLRMSRPALILGAGSSYDSAMRVVQGRLDISDNAVNALSARWGPAAVSVTGELGTVVERKVLESVSTSIRELDTVDTAVGRMREAFDAVGITPKNSWAMENIYRTQTNLAYAAGQSHANQHPAIAEILWGYEYVTVSDDRVRANHQALEGTRLQKNHPRWSKISPPCGYGCRCLKLEIYNDETDLAKAFEPPPIEFEGEVVQPEPDEGWDFDPGQVFAGVAVGI